MTGEPRQTIMSDMSNHTTTTTHITVDMASDLTMASDPIYCALVDIEERDDAAEVVAGVVVTEWTAYDLRASYVDACEQAWIGQAEALGYSAATADVTVDQTSDDDEAERIIGYWQQVWDSVTLPTMVVDGEWVAA